MNTVRGWTELMRQGAKPDMPGHDIKTDSRPNYCDHCHVMVDPALENCPLCRQRLTDSPQGPRMYADVDTDESTARTRGFYEDLLIFLSVAFLSTSVVLNIIYWNGKPWCLSVGSAILYVWIVLHTTVFRHRYFGTQMLLQLAGLMALFVSFDASAGWTGWSLNHVLPLLLTVCNVMIDFYSWVYKSRWKENLMCALTFAILGFVPMILYFTHVTDAMIPMMLSAISSVVSILGMLRFAVRTLMQEIKKRFHI